MPAPRIFQPCIPTRAIKVPTGPDWLHEIKHGRSRHWIKVKNPDAPAMRRADEVDWSGTARN
jgi:hypothetical protein